MACRLPGADGLEAFWDLVVHGRTAWGRLPDSRLPRDLYFDPEKSKVGKSYSDLGAIVSARPVDPAVCPIRPEMLDRYDVAHQIFLEVASLACRDAGLDPFAMPRQARTGVYVGHTGGSTRIGDYVYSTGIDGSTAWLGEVEAARELLGAAAESVAAEVTASIRHDHPGRRPGEKLDLGALGAAKIVREALQLDGPYLVVDAACASSLQALAIAARALQQGGIDQAIVGGASYCKSDSLVLFSAAQSVSNVGSCPFGRDADGLVTAEGYVALVVKTLSKAIADGDRIRAVIRGIGVASDGKGKSLWAPRQEGQKLAVERAYPDKSDIGRLDYIEAHATSTQVGDATELGALSALVSANLPAGKKIPIGSVKANIGHTLETAGMASLVKVVLAMEHGVIPPGSTCSDYNKDFDWEHGPFVVPSQPLPWPKRGDGEVRRAAVNAFGIGGLNVHLSLSEHCADAPAPALPPPAPKGTGDDEAVAIVGIGSVLPGALTVDAFRTLLREGKPVIGPVPASRFDVARALDPLAPRSWHTQAGVGGFVEGFVYDWRRHKVPPKQIAAANPLQFMLLEAADAAIAEVGGVAALDRVRTGVVVGTMFGGEFSNDLQMGLRLPETARYFRAALGRRGIAPHDIERIVEGYGKKLLEKMPALVDETGSFTSSTLASRLTKSFDLMGGALALDSGDCSGVSALSAAVDLLRQRECDAVLCASGQRYLDLMAFEGLSIQGMLADRPCSVFDAAIPGRVPAEGAVVLVLKRLSDARAAGNRIHGVIRGVAVGSGATVAGAASRVVREARLQAGIVPGAVAALEITGSGTTESNEPELRAVAAESGTGAVGGAVEALVGHLGAAAAAAGMIKLADVLASGRMPAMPAAGVARPGMPAASSEPVAVPAFDSSGYRAGSVTVVNETLVGHVVMDNGLPVPAAAREPAAVAATPAVSPAPLRARADARPGFRPLVAALFPGQGSQYTDMFRGLPAESAAARQAVERLDSEARAAGLETLAGIAWQPGNGMGTVVWDTQWGMYLADLLAWTVLEGMGFQPDLIASHSFGEFPSLVAAGAWSFAEGARATQARAAAVEQFGPKQGAMLSVIARRDEVAAAIEPFAGQVWVCAENAPEQSVIGGLARAVDAVEVVLEGRRIRSKRLAVPSPFHTPLLDAAAAKLGEAIGRMSIVPPQRRVYSSTTAAPMVTVDDVRQSLVRQMTQTVRWVDVVEKLWAEGVRTFVEVGPSGVLTGLSRRVLEGREGTTFIQFDQRGRDMAGHLARVRDQLDAAGALRALPATSEPVVLAPRAPRLGTVFAFDATARRRARNRAGSGPVRPSAPDRSSQPSPLRGASVANGRPAAVQALVVIPPPVLQSVTVKPVPLPGASPVVNRLAPPAVGKSAEVCPAAAVELERFLVDFVVDQTGYPQEIVELDADLEGDLGIDSIRKAQLFGEIGQRYGLSADSSVSLDDFRTLRHLLEYMLPRVGGGLQRASAPLPAVATPASPRGGHSANGHAPHGHGFNGYSTNSHAAHGHEGNGHVANGHATAVVAAPAERPASGELERFLVDFVVDQTGYPQEIVELDADLEGDLGIDSIRKAQLFGEIGQRYGLSADSSVSLDDFRTLRHLLDYMLPRVGGGAQRASAPPPAVASAAAPVRVAVALSALVEPAAERPASGELERFLVDFVVDQTGYPQEIVELDADLEGDLGIDSIRKAQLFGEIGQRYGLSADSSVSLDDFRTLRHLLEYMLPRVGGGAQQASAPLPAVVSAAAPVIDPVQAAAIRHWARELVAAAPAVVTPPQISPETAARLRAAAAGAGVDVAVLEAAMAAPTVAIGGLDVVVGGSAAGGRGIAIGFGRHAAPSCAPFSADGLSGHLVGVEGLPGGLLGWNDAGLIVVAGRGSGLAGGLPLTITIERLSCCRTLADAGRLAATLAPLGGTALVTVDGAIGLIDAQGRMVDGGAWRCESAALSALVKVAGDATGHVDLGRLLTATTGAGVRDGLSATATWLAAGAVDGETVSFAGGPRGSWLPPAAASTLAATWRKAAAAQAASAHPPATAEVTGRFGLALSALPSAVAARSLAGERIVVLSGADRASRALAAELVAVIAGRRGEAIVLPLTTTAEVVAGIDAAEDRGPVRHLVIAAPWSAGEDWVASRASALNAGYFACQRFLATRSRAGDADRSTLTAVTGLGGDFGIGGAIGSAVGGAYAGLCKNLAREYPEVQIRVADFATTSPAAEIAARVLGEIESAGPVEVGWQEGKRTTVVAVAARPRAAAPLAGLARGSVWLVTGGARGVTAACARELGARHALTLVLVGSTRPMPVEEGWLGLDEARLKGLKSSVMLDAKARGGDPRRAWRDVEKSIEIASGLAKFRAAGVNARYEVCDLADGAAVGQLVGRVEREVGPIRGIVHGAGWESACKFEKKTSEGLEATVGPKCIGLELVVAAVDPRHLESVVAFGSTSGRLGGLGQADYSLANDMLAKIVGQLRHGRRGLRATVFHWHAWDEVGMASRPESRFVLEQFGMKFMPLAEGVGRFMAEIEAGLPEAEVLVTEPIFCLDAAAAGAAHAPAAPRGSLVAAVEQAGRGTKVRFVLDPTADRFLTEHLQYQRPLLPAVMGAELLAQATLAAVGCERVEEIRDFVVERPLGFPTDQPREVRVEVEPGASGLVTARAWSTAPGADGPEGDLSRGHASAILLTGAAEPVTAKLDDLPLPFNPMVYQDDGPMWHGPSFRVLTGLFLDRSGGWGRLAAPNADTVAHPRGAAGWTVPVAMLDGAIVACAVYSYILCGKRVEIPVRFDRLRVVGRAMAAEKCTVRLFFRSQDPHKTVYDFVIYGADGRALVAVDGLHLAVLSPERSRPS